MTTKQPAVPHISSLSAPNFRQPEPEPSYEARMARYAALKEVGTECVGWVRQNHACVKQQIAALEAIPVLSGKVLR